MVGKVAGGAEVLFHGSGGLVHDDQPRRAFACLYKGVRHVARHEERIASLQAQDFVSCLHLEIALAHEEPLIDIGMVMKARPDLLRPKGIEDHTAAFVVFAGNLDLEDRVDELEGFVVAVIARSYQDFLPAQSRNLREGCSDG